MTSHAAVVRCWADNIYDTYTSRFGKNRDFVSKLYIDGSVNSAKASRFFEASIKNCPSVIHVKREKIDRIREEFQVSSISMSTVMDREGIFTCNVFDSITFGKKEAIWASHIIYSSVTGHALERLVERGAATPSDFGYVHLRLATISQAFNSAHCLGHDPKMPLLLPFRDGLLLGQSDLLRQIPEGRLTIFGKRGATVQELAQPKIATLLGNPPRFMLLRTFIGGVEGLTNAKSRAHQLLVQFFDKHDNLLRRFSDKVLFSYDSQDLAHALQMNFQNVGQELMAAVDKIQGKPVREVSEVDPLECAFRDPGDRAAIRGMLNEYKAILEDDAVASVLERAAQHVR